jgi:hypothetical protein
MYRTDAGLLANDGPKELYQTANLSFQTAKSLFQTHLSIIPNRGFARPKQERF